MLFGTSQRKQGTVISLQILFYLHPVHVSDPHGEGRSSSDVGVSKAGTISVWGLADLDSVENSCHKDEQVAHRRPQKMLFPRAQGTM
jgi:hypothetical protein